MSTIGKKIRRAEGSEIVTVGDIVSYSMRGANSCFDIQMLVPNDIWRTSHITVDQKRESVTIHNTMHTYCFARTGNGFACKCKSGAFELDADSSKALEEVFRQYELIWGWLKNKRRQ